MEATNRYTVRTANEARQRATGRPQRAGRPSWARPARRMVAGDSTESTCISSPALRTDDENDER